MMSEHNPGSDGLCIDCGIPKSEQGHRPCEPSALPVPDFKDTIIDRREALLRELRTKIWRIGAAMYVSFNIAVAGVCDDLVASIDAELGETPTTGGEVKK